MAEIVNLRQVRKARARTAAAAAADANRARFGRTKAERVAADAEATRLAETLDGAKRHAEREPSSSAITVVQD